MAINADRDVQKLLFFVMLLGAAAITAGITVRILSTMQTGVLTNNTWVTVTNETFSVTANGTYMTLSNSMANNNSENGGFTGVRRGSVLIQNNTVAQSLTEDTNFTFDYGLGRWMVTTAADTPCCLFDVNTGVKWNVTYDYATNNTGQDWETFKQGKKGVIELVSWLDDIAMVMAAIVILGFLFLVYGAYRQRI